MKKDYLKSYCKQYISKNNQRDFYKSIFGKHLTQGEISIKFEKKICSIFKVGFSITYSNGSTALLCCLMNIKKNLKDKKKSIILISNNTFVASANAAKLLGFRVIFVDINYDTGSVDLNNLKKIIKEISKDKIVAFINTYYAGFVYENVEIFKFLKKNNILYVEDACHAIGTNYKYNNNIYKIGSCTHSDFCIFSFHALKNITSGEGGVITLNNKSNHNYLQSIKNNGIKKVKSKNSIIEYDVFYNSSNFRLNEFQSALGLSQINELDLRKKKRINLYQNYLNFFKTDTPHIKILNKSNIDLTFPHLMVLMIDFNKLKITKKKIQETLLNKYGIGTQVHYKPLNKLKVFKSIRKNNYPNSNKFYKNAISVPLHNNMIEEDVFFVCKSLFKIIQENLK